MDLWSRSAVASKAILTCCLKMTSLGVPYCLENLLDRGRRPADRAQDLQVRLDLPADEHHLRVPGGRSRDQLDLVPHCSILQPGVNITEVQIGEVERRS